MLTNGTTTVSVKFVNSQEDYISEWVAIVVNWLFIYQTNLGRHQFLNANKRKSCLAVVKVKSQKVHWGNSKESRMGMLVIEHFGTAFEVKMNGDRFVQTLVLSVFFLSLIFSSKKGYV